MCMVILKNNWNMIDFLYRLHKLSLKLIWLIANVVCVSTPCCLAKYVWLNAKKNVCFSMKNQSNMKNIMIKAYPSVVIRILLWATASLCCELMSFIYAVPMLLIFATQKSWGGIALITLSRWYITAWRPTQQYITVQQILISIMYVVDVVGQP